MFGIDPRREGRLGEPSRDSDGKIEKSDKPTSMGKRIAALLGAVLVIVLTFAYVYSIATGKIFTW